MKRSKINEALRAMEAMAASYRFPLPPFCHFTPDEWAEKSHEFDGVRNNRLGWDITDYGMGAFDKVGFSLITLRNGLDSDPNCPKPYAEKLLYMKEGQRTPLHFHWSKMEDIINRGGGTLLIHVYNSTPEGEKADTPVTIYSDGRTYTLPAGARVTLAPGRSITIRPGMYHEFTPLPGTGPVLLGEVSMFNDDANDNRFYEPVGRFPAIEEDEEPYRLLCNEYPEARG